MFWRTRHLIHSLLSLAIASLATSPAARAQECEPTCLPLQLEPVTILSADPGICLPLLIGPVNDFLERDGRLWVAADGGLSLSDHVTENCTLQTDPVLMWTPASQALRAPFTFPQYISGPANTLAEYNGQLYVGGSFNVCPTLAQTDPCVCVDGNIAVLSPSQDCPTATWSSLGPGLNDEVRDMLCYKNELYVGGSFTETKAPEGQQGLPLAHIARWNGSTWSDVGGGLNGIVYSLLEVRESGCVSSLYVGGDFTMADPDGAEINVYNVARWDGENWFPVGPATASAQPGSLNRVLTMAVYDDGAGSELYIGGEIALPHPNPCTNGCTTNADGGVSWSIAKLNEVGTSWLALSGGLWEFSNSVTPSVRKLTVFDDGTGPALYAGGNFDHAGGQRAECTVPFCDCLDRCGVLTDGLARWRNGTWEAVSASPGGRVMAMLPFDDGTGRGPQLFIGGTFAPNDLFRFIGMISGCCGDPVPDDGLNSQFSVEGVGSRYLEVNLTCDMPASMIWVARGQQIFFLTEPFEIPGQGMFAETTADIKQAAVLTPQQWGFTVNAFGDVIVPDTSYYVSVVWDGGGVVDPSVRTWRWGDVNNDGTVNIADVMFIVRFFEGNFLVPLTAADLGPCTPDQIVNIVEDALDAVAAFQGQTFGDRCPGK